MIVADTGAILALLDADDRHHPVVRDLFLEDPDRWILPWAILPEVDYVATRALGPDVAAVFRRDVVRRVFLVDWAGDADLARAEELCRLHTDLAFGLVDAIVMATAERLEADAIATFDLRDFAPVTLRGQPSLYPRDLTGPTNRKSSIVNLQS